MHISNIYTLRISELNPGDLVRSVITSKVHKVYHVDVYWGNFQAKGPGGRLRTYTINPGGSQNFVKLTPEQKEAFLSELERSGVTDYWS